MIKLISRKISENLAYGQRSLKIAKIFEMDAYKTEHLNPEVKRKSSYTEDYSKKQKYRKKKKKLNENKISHANEHKPYTWFLALPSKFTLSSNFYVLRKTVYVFWYLSPRFNCYI